MPKRKVGIGAIGMLIFFGSLTGLLYALNAPRKVSYDVAQYHQPVEDDDQIFPEQEIIYPEKRRGLYYKRFLYILILPIPTLILLWVMISKIKGEQSIQILIRNVGSWLWSHAYMLAAILTIIYLIFALFTWHFGESEPPTQAVYPTGTPPLEGGSDYFAAAEVTGPRELRFGTSDTITLKVWIDQGRAPEEYAKLSPDLSYWTQASIQAVNFDIDENFHFQSGQTLTLNRPIQWRWVISPKEQRLGTQTVVINVDLTDEEHKTCRYTPYLTMIIDVRDPIGLPGSIVYGTMALGGVLGLPFWTWILDEWSNRRKEKRKIMSPYPSEKEISSLESFSDHERRIRPFENLEELRNHKKQGIEQGRVSSEDIPRESLGDFSRHERRKLFFESLMKELDKKKRNTEDNHNAEKKEEIPK